MLATQHIAWCGLDSTSCTRMPSSTLIPFLGSLGSLINPFKQKRAPFFSLGYWAAQCKPHMGDYENKGPNIDPQIAGFPDNEDPNKVPPPNVGNLYIVTSQNRRTAWGSLRSQGVGFRVLSRVGFRV